jgi:beta-ureidopropionase
MTRNTIQARCRNRDAVAVTTALAMNVTPATRAARALDPSPTSEVAGGGVSLLQAEWTGDKESMIEKHEKYAREARRPGRAGDAASRSSSTARTSARCRTTAVLRLHRADPRRPDHEADAGAGQGDRHGPGRADVRGGRAGTGIYYNTAAVIDADGTYLGKYRKTHIPHVKGFWEKFYFRPGNLGLPGVRHRRRQGRRVHLLRPPLPRGRAGAGPERRRDRVQPVGHVARPVEYLWRIEQVSHAVANGYFVGAINRVGIEPLGENDFYGQSYFVDPRGQFVGRRGRHGPYKES